MVGTTVQQETKVVTSAFVITLFDGVIKGKSGVNLQKFVDSLDSNLKKAIVEPVLKNIGLKIDMSDMSIAIDNQNKFEEYFAWKQEKAQFQTKLVQKTAQVLKEKFATAEVL